MSKQLNEKWAKEVDVKSTGENAGKSIDQLKKEIAAEIEQDTPGKKSRLKILFFAQSTSYFLCRLALCFWLLALGGQPLNAKSHKL